MTSLTLYLSLGALLWTIGLHGLLRCTHPCGASWPSISWAAAYS